MAQTQNLAVIIRHARNSADLVVDGAIAKVQTLHQHQADMAKSAEDLPDTPGFQKDCDQVIENMIEEMQARLFGAFGGSAELPTGSPHSFLDPSPEDVAAAFTDVAAASHVQVLVSDGPAGPVVHINVNGVCLTRLCRIDELDVQDNRDGPDPMGYAHHGRDE